MKKRRGFSHKKTKQLSTKQEVDVMKTLGGKAQTGSGARKGYKGDGRVFDRLRVECKFTTALTYKLSLHDLHKINGECEGKERPVMVIDYKEKGTGKLKGRYAVIPLRDFERLNDVEIDVDS